MKTPAACPTRAVQWHRRVLGLALPIMLANLTQPLLGAVDTAVAGHLPGAANLGGVAVGSLFFSLVFWSFGFLKMSTTGLIAHAFGAKQPLTLRMTLLRAILLAAVIGTAILLLQAPLLHLIIDLIGGSDAVREKAREYSAARIWAAPLALMNYAVLGYLLGCQRVKTALLIQILINLINIIAVAVLVYGFHLGIRGIGAATACADAAGLLFGAILLWHSRLRTLPAIVWRDVLNRVAMRQMFSLNRDIFLRTLFLLLSVGWFAHVGARQGDTILAANALLLNFQTFMAYALDAFAHAAEALAGAACGAKRRDDFRQAVRVTFLWSLAGALVIGLLYALAGPVIIMHLTNQHAVQAAALRYLPWIVVLPIASAGGYLLDGVFIGAMRTAVLMQAMAICLGVFLVAAAFFVSRWGNDGLWLAFTIYMLARAVVLGLHLPKLMRSIGSASHSTAPLS